MTDTVHTMPDTRYRAFISYSHADRRWGDWLHRALETYRVPSRLVGTHTPAGEIPRRIMPIFRDREELSSAADLNAKVNEVLHVSANLIVICSPHSAASRWVNEEVLEFKRLGLGDRIFCLIVDGEPNASEMPGREHEECFCPALRFRIGADGRLTDRRAEPIAADARAGKDGRSNAKLKLIAGLLDVGFDVLKQRELQRRNRRMTAITALALAVMTVTTALAIVAVRARHAAERRQKQAEDLVNFMLGDLNDKLSQINRLDIIESVDDKAMDYFKSLPTSDVTEKALIERSKALERIGMVRFEQGHLDAALDSFRDSLKLISAIARKKPNDLKVHLAWAEVQTFVGTTFWFQGKLGGAERNFRVAERILQHVEHLGAGNPKFLAQMFYVENNLGHVFESRGKLVEAQKSYKTELNLAKSLVASDPGKVSWNEHLGDAHNNLGKLALTRGDLVTAIAEYAADNRIETTQSDRHPRNNNQRQNMFRVRAILGRTLALAGFTDEAIRDLRDAVKTAGRLHAEDTTITSITSVLALYRMQLSRLLRLTGHLQEAVKLTGQSFDAFTALTKRDPSNASWQYEFAVTRIERAAQLAATGKSTEAGIQLDLALVWLEPALKKHPQDRSTLLATLDARLRLVTLQGATDESKTLESCLAAIDAVKSGNDDPRLLALKVRALLGLGREHDAQPVIEKLQSEGYRDLAFVAILQQAGIEYPPNLRIQNKIRATLSSTETKGAVQP